MFFKCVHNAPHTDHGYGQVQTARKGNRSFTVDIHCHVHVPEVDAMLDQLPANARVQAVDTNPITAKINQEQKTGILPKLTDAEVRIADMDVQGIDVQALAPAPFHYNYGYPDDFTRETSIAVNNRIAEIVASHPDRFVGMGTVPMQNAELAVTEMDRCIDELGFKGIEINTNVNGEDITRVGLEKFFARAEERGTLLFMHPIGTSIKERMGDHYFRNLIGHPIESALAVGHLIFDGYLERYPGLKICIAHGGGYIPAYAGRFDHPHPLREDCRVNIPKLPSEYLKKLYFDTVVFSDHQLKYLVETWGANRVVMGTDYPYDMAETDPVGHVCSVPSFTDEQRALIMGGNAAELLGIDPAVFARAS